MGRDHQSYKEFLSALNTLCKIVTNLYYYYERRRGIVRRAAKGKGTGRHEIRTALKLFTLSSFGTVSGRLIYACLCVVILTELQSRSHLFIVGTHLHY